MSDSKPKRAGIWEHFDDSAASRLDGSRRTHAWLNPSSGEVHRVYLLLALFLLGGLLMLFDTLGTFAPHPRPVGSGELSLNGDWTIRFDDDPRFSSWEYDALGWCPTAVPDPRQIELDPAAMPAECPTRYPSPRMRNATYWYRRTVVIPPETQWSEPALFLGKVRSRARVFWDGEFIGVVRDDRTPIVLELEQRQVRAGSHLLALRVESGYTERPGIDHGYRRGIALGELARSLPLGGVARREVLVVAMLAALFQVVVFSLLVFLTIQGRGAKWDLSWLSLFFGSTLIHSIHPLTDDPLGWYLRSLALGGWATSLLGLGLDWYPWSERIRQGFARLCAALWLVLTLGYTYAFQLEAFDKRWLETTTLAVTVLPLAVYALSALTWLFRGSVPVGHRGRPAQAKLATLLLVLSLYGLNVVAQFSLLKLPDLILSPFFQPLVSCLVFYFAVDAYTDTLRSVAFFGRFIRPGLKKLIEEMGRNLHADDKLFRARKTVVMKIDMANYTRTCYKMPYGVRRLFLDLWYTEIDQVVADKVFFDKSLGDGSVYCFGENIDGGPCSAALEAALRIRDHKLPLFDTTFRQRLQGLLDTTPELRPPTEAFMEDYERRVGESFLERRTEVRIALTTGYVDEGLWGLPSQSHYDVQGGSLALAARIEASAENGEILFDRDFLEEVLQERPGWFKPGELASRSVDLRGIGAKELFAIPVGWQAAGDVRPALRVVRAAV